MSGGVDSTVAAALLVEQGYAVTGMMLRLWCEPGSQAENACCTPEAREEARMAASQIGIPFFEVDASEIFYKNIIQYFVDGYQRGTTPNPCVVCNRTIKWGVLLDAARSAASAGTLFATGHYAQIRPSQDGKYQLFRGLDETKDQSYVLHALNQDQLGHTLLPLGGFRKTEVVEMAKTRGFSAAYRKESQDLCFVGDQDYREFLTRYAPGIVCAGKILNRQGECVGEHQGLAFYTIGQRKGLGIASPAPLYVLEKDIENNNLIVGTLDELGRSELRTHQLNWIDGMIPEQPFRARVKIRYKAEFAPALVLPQLDGSVVVRFDDLLRDITPGQFAVFYEGDRVLGGGTIVT
jgi:tRNA-uridine 2-sulfurtransferase